MRLEYDLSVVVTAHDETLVCGPTMHAAEAAIRYAEENGISVERIIALDNATPETTTWFSQKQFSHWTRHTFQQGDLGRVRNAVVPLTKGRFIAFLDSDDLFSENWLALAAARLKKAARRGKRAIAHPELNWLFDGAHSVYLKPDQASAMFSPWHFYAMNYYDSLCVAPREAHLEHPYVHRNIPAGLSFQDWHFSIETMAAGWEHVSVRDTIIFKRRRDNSLVNESRNRRAIVRQLDAMAIDRVATLGANTPRRKPARPDNPLFFDLPPKSSLSSWVDGLLNRTASEAKHQTESQSPFYGTAFAQRVANARAWKGGLPDTISDELYEEADTLFDYAYYLAAYPDIRDFRQFDPLAHFLRKGWKESRNPAPWFSTQGYLLRFPDVAESGENPFIHWLTKGRNAGYLPQPIPKFDAVAKSAGLTPEQALATWHNCYCDLRHRLEYGPLGEQVLRAASHEPLVEQGWMEALTVKVPPFHSDEVGLRTAGIFELSQAADMRRARHVICVNRARFGSAPRIEGHLARALAERHGAENVIVVTTDVEGPMPEGKLPEGVRHVDFAALVPHLRGDKRQRLLVEFLRALHPETVFNVNSRLLWDLLSAYGTALAASCRLYAVLLCNEQTDLGYWTGYPLRRFYRHFDVISGVITDSDFLVDDLTKRYMLPPDQAHRLQAVPNPVDPTIPIVPAPAADTHRRPQVFWAGRLDAQKRVDLMIQVATECPDYDFRVWGASVMSDTPLPDDLPANIVLEGAYERFADLPLNEADVWLYTSAWDGVPTMLLEVAMTGIPLVGSLVGGTGEVLRKGLAQGLSENATPKDWARALRSVIDAPETARDNALDLRTRLIKERSAQTHADALFGLLDRTPDILTTENNNNARKAAGQELPPGKAT